MALTPSTMIELGAPAPDFTLPDAVSGRDFTRDEIAASSSSGGLLVMFICVHCPYVKHVAVELSRIGAEYAGRIGIVAISSNDIVEFPQDAPAEMKKQADLLGFRFPYLFDETQQVARAYHAACTPDFFLYDRSLHLAYRGQLDDSRPRRSGGGNDIPLSGKDLRAAMDAVIVGKVPSTEQRTSLGCNIKWKSR